MRFFQIFLFVILFVPAGSNSTAPPESEQSRTTRLPLTQAEKSIVNSVTENGIIISKLGEMRFRYLHSEYQTEDSLHPHLYHWKPDGLKWAFGESGLIKNNKLEFKEINFTYNDTQQIKDSKGRLWNLTFIMIMN